MHSTLKDNTVATSALLPVYSITFTDVSKVYVLIQNFLPQPIQHYTHSTQCTHFRQIQTTTDDKTR